MSIIMLKPPPKQFPSHQTVANEKIVRVIRKIIVRDHFCPPYNLPAMELKIYVYLLIKYFPA